jgi:hypothetical protein
MMTRRLAALTVAAALLLPHAASAEDPRPAWITEEHLALLRQLRIDPVSDLEAKGNYHWRWRSNHVLSIGGYRCPEGSTLSVSRSIVLISASLDTPCDDAQGHRTASLKIYPDGSVQPIG